MANSVPDGRLTNGQIVSLGANISGDNMKKIATGYMNISKEVVRNIADKNRYDSEGFTRDVLEKWKSKPQNLDHNQVKKLAFILYQAADECRYVDPIEVQKILHVSREDLGLSDAAVTEKELSELAEKLRPITEGRMNIDMIQWAENNTVKMEDLYTELKIDKLENKPMGVQSIAVKDYKELFKVVSGRNVKGKRVLGKGDPGSGKTTFAKKVAWDCAKGDLKDFSLVFFISMKLVQQGDLIEDVILQQTPELSGLKVTEQNLRDILGTFGSHCLIILDGYDEHISGDNKPNEDVIKLLRGQKFLSCHMLLTSRPHCIAEIEQNFGTIVKIQGFTEKHAREFASRVLVDKDKIDPIMEIQCLNSGEFIKEGKSGVTFPILLLFVCVLVNGDEINLAKKEVTLGEIYMRLVRCLYRKYTVRKGIAFKHSEFVEVLRRVGKLALHCLISGRYHMQRSQILLQIGEDAFDYGLLIGHEVFETDEIFISFHDRTIQEFLGSFSSVLMLDRAESIEILRGDDLILVKIPLFLRFSLWFLGKDCNDKYFLLENKDTIYRQIEALIINIINVTYFNSTLVAINYPAQNIYTGKLDELVEQFVQKMLSKCTKIKHLLLDERDYIGQIMSTLCPLLPQLSSIQLPFLADGFGSEELHIVIGPGALSRVDELLTHCRRLDKPLSLYLAVTESKNLCKYLTADISALTIVALNYMETCLSGLHKIHYSPNLTSVNLYNQILDEDFALALSNGVEKGNLPNLRLLGLRHCDTKGKLHLLFQIKWPTLTHLDLSKCFLDKSDIQVLCNIKVLLPNLKSLRLFLGDALGDFVVTDVALTELSSIFHSGKFIFRFKRHIALFDMFESPLPNITELWMTSMNKHEYKKLVAAINRGALPQLRELGISMWEHVDKNQMVDFFVQQINEDGLQCDVIKQGNTLDWLPPVNAPTLISLTLHRFICSIFHLAMVMQSTVLTKLHKLDISHSSGMTGALSRLLCHNFPSLNTLILSDCGLNSQDLCSLAQARAKGRLPELRHLDISHNDRIKGKLKYLFSYQAQWENLCSLVDSKEHDVLESHPFSICKEQLSELAISEKSINFLFQPGNRCWKYLNKIHIAMNNNNQNIILDEINDALERGLLPSLNYIGVTHHGDLTTNSLFQEAVAHLLPNNVIDKVLDHIERILLPSFYGHHFDVINYYYEAELARGETRSLTTILTEMATERVDISSVFPLVEDVGLNKAETAELTNTVCICLAICIFQGSVLSRLFSNVHDLNVKLGEKTLVPTLKPVFSSQFKCEQGTSTSKRERPFGTVDSVVQNHLHKLSAAIDDFRKLLDARNHLLEHGVAVLLSAQRPDFISTSVSQTQHSEPAGKTEPEDVKTFQTTHSRLAAEFSQSVGSQGKEENKIQGSDLLNATECPVCFKEFQDPRTLPCCLKSLCLDCLKKLQEDSCIKCPLCNREHNDPDPSKVLRKFPENQIMTQLITAEHKYRTLEKLMKTQHSLDQADENIPDQVREESLTNEAVEMSSLYALAKGVLKHRVQIVEIVHGSSVTIQALNSDVILHVPDGVYGIILGNIRTDHWLFRDLVGDKDCIISPICQYHFRGSRPKSTMFRIQVPHIVSDIDVVRDKIEVSRLGRQILRGKHLAPYQMQPVSLQNNDLCFRLSDRYVEIFSRQFSQFIVTSNGISCCCQNTTLLVFSRMDPPLHPEDTPVANMALYFASDHYKIEDYKQKVIDYQHTNKRSLVQQVQIMLSKNEGYNRNESCVELIFHELDGDGNCHWKAYRGSKLHTVMELDSALSFSGQHICKTRPNELSGFLFKATYPSDTYRVEMTVKVAIVSAITRRWCWFWFWLWSASEEQSKKKVEIRENQILFDPRNEDTAQGAANRALSEASELTDEMILKLSECITCQTDLRKLGTKGLKVDAHVIDSILTNEHNDINTAAYKVLQNWRNTQENMFIARGKLCSILRGVGMPSYISKALRQ